jgi:hypothetical protein
MQPIVALPDPGKTEMVESVTLCDHDSSSEDGGNCESDSNLSESAKDSGDSDIGDSARSKRRGKVTGRWSTYEEARLRAYIREDESWSWIASKLRRSETAVKQHWGIMCRRKAGFQT